MPIFPFFILVTPSFANGFAIFTSGLYQLLHQFGVREGSVYEQFTGVAETGYTISPERRDGSRPSYALDSSQRWAGGTWTAGHGRRSFLFVKMDRMANGGNYWRIGEAMVTAGGCSA